jgi:hypothetical protein
MLCKFPELLLKTDRMRKKVIEMTTETEERTELVEPDQDSGSPASGGSAAGSTAELPHTPPAPEEQPQNRIQNFPEPDGVRYRKGCDGEYEACYRLRKDGWIVSRWQGYPSPPDLIVVRSDEILLVMVRRLRQPVPDAHAAFLRYRDGLACLRDIGSPAIVRKEAWIFCPPDGCHCYEVLPGGIRRIRREWEKKGAVPETPSAEVPFPRTTRKTGEERQSTEMPFSRSVPKTGEETPSPEVPYPQSAAETARNEAG